MTATLDTHEMFRVRELFDPDPFRRPPEMPVFRDEPPPEPMPKKPDPPKKPEPDELPFYHWSRWQSLTDARLRCAERSLSDSDSDDVKAAIMREAVSDEPCAKEAKAYVPIRTFKRPKS